MVIKNGTDEDRLTMAELLEQYDEAMLDFARRQGTKELKRLQKEDASVYTAIF